MPQSTRSPCSPLMAPSIVAVGAFALMLAWNEYLYAFMFLSTETQITIPVMLGFFLHSDNPVWPVDNSVFLVSDASQLVRLDARTGEVIWAIDLPLYRKEKTHRDSFAHYGPVLAGGRLIVASSDGEMRSYDPVNGDLLGSVSIPSGAASQPAIVDGVLYVLSQNGQLHAYR